MGESPWGPEQNIPAWAPFQGDLILARQLSPDSRWFTIGNDATDYRTHCAGHLAVAAAAVGHATAPTKWGGGVVTAPRRHDCFQNVDVGEVICERG